MSPLDADEELLTLQEAADELKVHYMTAYRWVRRGDLPAFKAGGRLRLRRSELERYKDSRSVTAGQATEPTGRRDWQMHLDRMIRLLLDGEASDANAMVRKIVGDGASASEIYTELLTPALHRVGEYWEAGVVNVAVEHRATAITSGIMSRLSDHFRRRGPRRGVAATLTAPNEAHGVASAMIADFLRLAGWEVHHLGADVPLEDLKLFLDIVPVDVVCVSVAQDLDPASYDALAEACEGRQLIMGGRGCDLAIAEPLGITVLEDPAALVAHLEAFTPSRDATVSG